MSDREDIRELVVRFADALNRLDAVQFEYLWTPHATWIIDPPTDFASEAPREELAERFVDAIQTRYSTFFQLVQGTVVDIDVDGDVAFARSYVTELAIPRDGVQGYFNHGTYHDELERIDEGWRFRRRHYRYLYIDTRPIAGEGAPVGGTIGALVE